MNRLLILRGPLQIALCDGGRVVYCERMIRAPGRVDFI